MAEGTRSPNSVVVRLAFVAVTLAMPLSLASQGIDTTPPTVSITAPAAGATISGATPVTVNAADNVGVAGVQFAVDGVPLGAEITAAPYSTTWMTQGSTDLIFGVVKLKVAPMTISAGSGLTKRLGVSCPSCAGDDTASVDGIQSTAGDAAATFTFSAPAHYLAHVAAFKAATTPAYLQGAAATTNVAGTSLAKAFAAPMAAGSLIVAAVAWQGNAPLTVTDTQGNSYAVAITAYDAALGQSLAILYAANVNAGATTVTAAFGSSVTAKRLELHEYGGMAATTPLDGAATASGEGTTTPDSVTSGAASTTAAAAVSDGSHTLTAVARDAAGNRTTSVPVTISVGLDTVSPVISNVTVSSVTGSGATIGWTTDEASDSQVDFGLTTAYGSTSALNATRVTAHTVTLSGLSGGTLHHVRARSRDAAGNLAVSGDVTFTTFDTTPPTVSITAPAAGATVSGATTVTANAADNVGVAGVQFAVDGVPLGAEITAAPYSTTWMTQGSTDLIFGVVKHAVGGMTIAAGSGMTKRLGVSCPTCAGDDTASVDRIQSTAGNAAATFTFSAPAHYIAHVVGFKAATTPAYLQGATATTNVAGSNLATAFTAPLTAGSLIVAAVAWQGSAPLTVTDTQGNSYAVAATGYDSVMGQSLAILYAANVTAGTTTVTADFGSLSPTVKRLELHEYGGMATANPFDGTAMSIGEGSTTPDAVTSGAATTTVIDPVPNGSHTLTAVARDAAGNQTTSVPVTITVGFDTTPPVISNVITSSVTASGATISWTTNESSTSQVSYGPTTAYGSTSALDATPVTAHTVSLSGLSGSSLYHARVQSRDAAGNLAVSSDFTLTTLDGAAPSVSITTPAGGAIVSASIPVTASASDNVGVVGVQMRLDGAPLGAEVMTSPYTMSWNTATAASGSHTLTAIARDTAGNQTTSAAVIVTVSSDSTPPAISAVTVSSITATAATIGWTTDEASDSQVDFGLTTAYGSTSALNATPVTAHTVNLSGLNGGTLYHARVRSRDAAGNLAVSADVTFTTLDTSPPTVSISAPAAGATVSGTTTVNANAADNVGVAGVQFAVDGVPLGAEITAAPYSTPWTTRGSKDLVFGVVKVAVGAMTITAGSGLTKRLGVSCAGCSGDDTASVDRIQSTAGTAAATFTFSAPAHYIAHVAAFKAATTPAYLQGATATTNVAGTNLATAFAAPMTAGSLIVAAVAWQGSAPLTVTDTRGNSYAVAATGYDSVMGQSLAILYAANVTAGATTVTADFGSLSPTVKRLELHEYAGMATANPFDGTAMTIGEGPTTPDAVTSGAAPTTVTASVPDGTHTLTALARDAAGNAATSAAVSVTVTNDATAPTVSITSPAGGAMVTGMAMVTANATDNTGVAGVQFRLDGVSLGTEDTTAPYSVSWNTATAANGSHALTAIARDAAGSQTTSAGVNVTVSNDTTPPAVSITAPAAGAFVTGTVTLTANASDNTGVAGVQFKLDGASLGAEDTTAPYSVAWNTTTATNASHTLTAIARDAAGNVMTSAAITVTVSNDTTPPVISAVTVSSLQSSSATIGWATNELSDSEVEYGLTTAYGGFSSLDVSLVTAHTRTLVGLAPSTLYHFRARSRDVAGNLGLSADFTLTTLEGTPPSVSITAPTSGSTVSGTVTVTASASDNVGVVGVEFRLDGVPGVEDTAAPYTVLWDTTAQSSGSHTLTAVARDAAGNRTTSAVVTVTVAGPTGQVTLAWDASTDARVVGVKVYVGTTSGVYDVRVVDVGNVTGYIVTGLQSGTVYFFAVTGYDQVGMESGFSNEVSTTVP